MIDILLATYNGERYLAQQIDSLLRQTHSGWRLLAHDDGSSDSTVDILRSYQHGHPDKIYLIEDGLRTGGAKNNFAHLMEKASAEYVMFCDQDDVWIENKIALTLKKMVEEETANPGRPVLVHSDLMVVDEQLNVIAKSMFAYQRLAKVSDSLYRAMAANNITGCTVMMNRKALQVSLPIPAQALMHDWWAGCKVLQHGGVIGFIDQPLIRYRQHGANAVGSKEVTVWYYVSRLSDIKSAASSLGGLWRQARALESGASFSKLIAAKCASLADRIFK